MECTPCILGHIQRGGPPVAKDRILATKMGVAAVQGIIDGRTNVMVAEQDNVMHLVALGETIKHHKLVSKQLVDAQENILAVTAHPNVNCFQLSYLA